jgi:hypothetical protein
VDNVPAVNAVVGANLTKNLKHIPSKYLYARLAYQERRMLFVHCKADYLLSDALTKPLSGSKFLIFKSRLLGEYVGEHDKRELTLPNGDKLITGNFRNVSKALSVFIEKENLQECLSEDVEEYEDISIY